MAALFKEYLKRIWRRLPDRPALYLRHCFRFRRLTNPWRPRSLNEHILRLMMDTRDRRRRVFADKLETRDYITMRVGPGYLPKLYMQTDDLEKIDFSALPDKFVLKATHGSNMNQVVFDKANLNIDDLKIRMREWLATDYGKKTHEWVYMGLRPRLFAEELLEEEPGKLSYDYKLFCFHGRTKLIQVVIDRSIIHSHVRTHAFYDPNWQRVIMSLGAPQGPDIVRPLVLGKMLRRAEELSNGFDFIRVDMYVMKDRVVIGELTNFPEGGNCRIEPLWRDYWLGRYFDPDNT